MGRSFPCSRVCVEESVGNGILVTRGGMSMRDNVLNFCPAKRILELYLRTAVQKRRHARFSAVSPLHLRHKPAISIIKTLMRGQSQPTERFVQPQKSEKAISDSWNLTRLLEAIIPQEDAPSPQDPDQLYASRVWCRVLRSSGVSMIRHP